MDENKKVEETETSEEQKGSEPSQEKDPVAAELEKVEQKPKRTRLETLKYNKEKWDREYAEELKKEGLEDDNRPMTVAEFKAMQQETAQTSAIKMADRVENENERKLLIHHLENTIKPSGDAETDFKNALMLVNATKNRMVSEEVLRGVKPKAAGSGASAPPKEEQKVELTKEERDYMMAFKLTPEQVIAARSK